MDKSSINAATHYFQLLMQQPGVYISIPTKQAPVNFEIWNCLVDMLKLAGMEHEVLHYSYHDNKIRYMTPELLEEQKKLYGCPRKISTPKFSTDPVLTRFTESFLIKKRDQKRSIWLTSPKT